MATPMRTSVVFRRCPTRNRPVSPSGITPHRRQLSLQLGANGGHPRTAPTITRTMASKSAPTRGKRRVWCDPLFSDHQVRRQSLLKGLWLTLSQPRRVQLPLLGHRSLCKTPHYMQLNWQLQLGMRSHASPSLR